MFLENTVSEYHVNIISFDVPYPPNYGGVIDVFFKIKAFHQAGVKVHLHCFQYGRDISLDLENLCESVTYYKRNVNKTLLFHKKPYIVISRANHDLIHNLLKNDYPILFEGLHSCYYLDHEGLKNRRKIVRTHNIEHDYYLNLARVEKSIFKRYYFYNESVKLKNYESILHHANGIAAISKNDQLFLAAKYDNVEVVSAFHPSEYIDIKEGLGEYALYHGTLSIGENNDAALFLINKVFNDIDVPLIVAGNKPSNELKTAIAKYDNIRLISDVTTESIYELIHNAQINVLPTFQATGIKLKLLAALFRGRHCLVNTPMISNTGLEVLCTLADTPDEMKKEVLQLFSTPFNSSDIQKRKEYLLNNGFTNEHNIRKLMNMLFA